MSGMVLAPWAVDAAALVKSRLEADYPPVIVVAEPNPTIRGSLMAEVAVAACMSLVWDREPVTVEEAVADELKRVVVADTWDGSDVQCELIRVARSRSLFVIFGAKDDAAVEELVARADPVVAHPIMRVTVPTGTSSTVDQNLQQMAAALTEVVAAQPGLSVSDALREAAKRHGVGRGLMKYALSYAVTKDMLSVDYDTATVHAL